MPTSEGKKRTAAPLADVNVPARSRSDGRDALRETARAPESCPGLSPQAAGFFSRLVMLRGPIRRLYADDDLGGLSQQGERGGLIVRRVKFKQTRLRGFERLRHGAERLVQVCVRLGGSNWLRARVGKLARPCLRLRGTCRTPSPPAHGLMPATRSPACGNTAEAAVCSTGCASWRSSTCALPGSPGARDRRRKPRWRDGSWQAPWVMDFAGQCGGMSRVWLRQAIQEV